MLKKKPEVVPEPEEEKNDEEPKEKDENAQETKEETKEETAKEDDGSIRIDNVTINNIEDLNDLKKLSSDYETVKEWKQENKTHKLKLIVNSTLHGLKTLSSESKQNVWARLKKLDERDKKIYETRKAKNDFEELIYKSWDWVNTE